MVNVTLGQTGAGWAASANHQVCIGFQCAADAPQSGVYLPAVNR